MPIENKLYRFRSCDRLLDCKELENEYFYISDKSQLNDPMEGHIDFYWRGDSIVWKGLFKHYIWQLYYVIMMIPLKPPLTDLEKLFITRTEIIMKDTKLAVQRKELEEKFVKDEKVKHLADLLGNSNISITNRELPFILFCIHGHAVKHVLDYLKKTDMIGYIKWIENIYDKAYRSLLSEGWEKLLGDPASFKSAAYAVDMTRREVSLIAGMQQSENEEERRILQFVFAEFADNYVKQITRLAYADGYCVCFTRSIANPSLWGYYADNHKGVALIFDYRQDENIDLFYHDAGTDEKEYISKKLQKVTYDTKCNQMNFFLTLGHLFGDERSHWLIDQEKESQIISECRNMRDYGGWYYQKLSERFLRKNSTWKEEDELRIVIDDDWKYHGDENRRKYQYSFNRLKGIVFGLCTSYADKRNILTVLQRKCESYGRMDFEIYEAVFNTDKGNIEPRRMKLVEKALITHT